MNSATLASLSNVPLLPICYYISAFSTFFISKDLMTINDENQSISVINALFEYLNRSKNESLAKNQLLLEVLDKTNFNQRNWNRTLDIKDVNEAYQYMITAGLLHHCRNITGYLSGKETITLSEFRNIEGLLEKCINHNPCSTINETRKLTPLAIEKLLEYIWIAYNQEKIVTETKRFKRQPPTYTHNFHALDSEIENVIASKLLTDPNEHFSFTDEQKQQLYSFLIDPRDSANSIDTHGEYFNHQSSGSNFLLLTSEENLNGDQQNAATALPNILETSEIVKVGSKRPNRIIDNDLDSDNVPSTSKKSSYAFLQQYANSEQQRQESLSTGDGGKSKRMLYIEEAAKMICSCVPSRNLVDTVDMLKGFLLKLEKSDTLVPTYNEFANEFCGKLGQPSGYDGWKIPTNCTFINDLLFKSHLDAINITEFKNRCTFFKNYPVESFGKDVKMYQSSIKLRKSLQIKEFLLLRFHLVYSETPQPDKSAEVIKQITTAHYNLALRECEEDWINEKITLYAIDYDRNLIDLRNDSSARRYYTFKKYVEFSPNISEAKNKLQKYSELARNLVLFVIEFENQAGIVNIDRLLDDDTSGRYMVPIDSRFVITDAKPKNIDKHNVFLIKMRDDRLKEEKMVKIVKYLFKNSQSTKKCSRKLILKK